MAKIMGYFRNFTENVSAHFPAICSDNSRNISLVKAVKRYGARHIATCISLTIACNAQHSSAVVETGLNPASAKTR